MSEVQDSGTDPVTPQNPVEQLLVAARRVGGEYCWPSSRAAAVASALGELRQAVLGWELWDLGPTGSPRVVEWSTYEVTLQGPWPEIVGSATRAAVEGFREREGEGFWVNITWISEMEASQVPGGRAP